LLYSKADRALLDVVWCSVHLWKPGRSVDDWWFWYNSG